MIAKEGEKMVKILFERTAFCAANRLRFHRFFTNDLI